MGRPFHFSENEFYHGYNRGVDKRSIFMEDADKKRFMKLLYLCNSEKPVNLRELPKGESFGFDRGQTLVDVCAFCLMSNHFHILLREKQSGGISLFIKKLATAYVMYFNEKYQRTGALFEGPFRARHVDSDRYLQYLLAYLHLNPIDMIESGWKELGIKNLANSKKFLAEYPYSSMHEYSRPVARTESVILNKYAMPEYFSTSLEFDDFINDWLTIPKGESFGKEKLELW